MKWVEIRGFRSVARARLDLTRRTPNVLMGLNDHGKSNFLRAIHLFFTGRVEPAVPFDFERDFCASLRGKKGQRQQIVVEVGFSPDLVHPKLLSSVERQKILGTEQVSVRRIWRRAGVQSALVLLRRNATPKVYAVEEEGSASLPGEAAQKIPAHAPVQFMTEMERLLSRFRVHYLPSNKAASSFQAIGLSDAVKRYIFDPYAKGQNFQNLAEGLRDLREHFHAAVQDDLGNTLAARLDTLFPGISASGLTLPEKQEELVNTGEVAVTRAGGQVPLSACGSGLQSILMLEILAYLDSHSVTRSQELEPRFVWLIEEPEAFLYEDLIGYAGSRLREVSRQDRFTVVCTSHSRDAALATQGRIVWVTMDPTGSQVSSTFDLSSPQQMESFREYSRGQLGTGAIEAQLRQWVEDLGAKQKESIQRVLCVEGKHDEEVIKRLLEVCKKADTPNVRVLAPVTGSQNAEHVKLTVLTLSELLPTARVVGLFDNDYEGISRHRGLTDQLDRVGRTNAVGLVLPSTLACQAAPTGYIVESGGVPSTKATGESVDLTGKSLTMEALYDEPGIVAELIHKDMFWEHWVAKAVKVKVHKAAYSRLRDDSCKGAAAQVVITRLAKGRCGSLQILFDEVLKAFRRLDDGSRITDREPPTSDLN